MIGISGSGASCCSVSEHIMSLAKCQRSAEVKRGRGGQVGKKCVFLNWGSYHPAQGALKVQVGPVSLADGLELWMMGLVKTRFDVCDDFKLLLPVGAESLKPSWVDIQVYQDFKYEHFKKHELPFLLTTLDLT